MISTRIRSALLFAGIWSGFIAALPLVAQVRTVELNISGSPETVPALQYRLLHNHAELKPGDAAPVYLRVNAGISPERLKELNAQSEKWLDRPIDATTYPEVRDYVKKWELRLQQIEFGAARRDCSWNYTIDEQRENIFEVLLPDAQMARDWTRILCLKARVEIYEKRFDEAAKTIRTGFAYGRHVAQGPFGINGLVGNSMAALTCAAVEEWISKPDSPNLYWSLTALPRPMTSIRNGIEVERFTLQMLLSEMVVEREQLTIAEWDARLLRLHKRLLVIREMPFVKIQPEFAERSKKTLDDYRAWILPEARKYAESHPEMKYEGDSQLILTYIWRRYQELYDDLFKPAYLPFPESRIFYEKGMANLKKIQSGPLWMFEAWLPSLEAMHLSEAKLDRRIAILRIIEALRLHLKTNPKPPATLAELQIVPIPADPLTGRAFDYEVSGNVVSLGDFKIKSQNNIIYKLTVKPNP